MICCSSVNINNYVTVLLKVQKRYRKYKSKNLNPKTRNGRIIL